MYYTNELYHHGIKGQRWGIRRFQNYSGAYTAAGRIRYGIKMANDPVARSLPRKQYRKSSAAYQKLKYKTNKFKMTEAQKKRAIEIGKKVAIGVGAVAVTAISVGLIRKGVITASIVSKNGENHREAERLVNIDLSELNTENVKIEKGATLSRKTRIKDEDVSDKSKLYTTTNKEDADRYVALFGSMKAKEITKPAYRDTYEVKKEMTGASERKRMIIFMGEMSNPQFRKDALAQINESRKKRKEPPLTELDPTRTRQYYDDFMIGFGNNSETSRPANEALKRAHQRHGFDIYADDQDAGRWSNTPTIVLDPAGKVQKTGSKKVGLLEQVYNGYTVKNLKHTPEQEDYYKSIKKKKS